MEEACRLHPSGKRPVHILHWDGEDRKLSCEGQPWSIPAHRQGLLFDSPVKLQQVVSLTLWLKSKGGRTESFTSTALSVIRSVHPTECGPFPSGIL